MSLIHISQKELGMSRQSRRRKCQARVCNAESLKRCVTRVCDSSVFKAIRFAERCTWTPQTLSAASLFWTWSDECTLTDRFSTARTLTKSILKVPETLSSAYQPFMRMQHRWSDDLTRALTASFRQTMTQDLAAHFRRRQWAVFAIEGSRFEVPRTISNQSAFSPKSDNGKRKRRVRKDRLLRDRAAEKKSVSPQMWVTVLWHVDLGLPWDWRRGESGSSERQHLVEMLAELPPRSMITADAGFAGYEVWKAILDRGHDLLIRVGGNTTLLRKLGVTKENCSTVYLWPEKAASTSQPPLVLRLVVLKRGKKRVYFVTSILNPNILSDQKLLSIAKRRWGVEVFYRSYKQTLNRRRLLSRTPATCLAECSWTMLGLWLLGLLTVSRIAANGQDPLGWSVALARNAVRRAMRLGVGGVHGRRCLFRDLSAAVKDGYWRRGPKPARDYPRKKREKPPGPPKLQSATVSEVRQANRLRAKLTTAA